MKRFEFKLEKVLELRRYAERTWELKLAEVTGRVVAAEQEMQSWGQRRFDAGKFHAGAGTLDMTVMRSREEYVNRIDQRVLEIQHQLVALETERSKVREGFLDASRKRKALTRLKERRSEEYYQDAKREEVRVLDEIGGGQVIRRRMETEEIDV